MLINASGCKKVKKPQEGCNRNLGERSCFHSGATSSGDGLRGGNKGWNTSGGPSAWGEGGSCVEDLRPSVPSAIKREKKYKISLYQSISVFYKSLFSFCKILKDESHYKYFKLRAWWNTHSLFKSIFLKIYFLILDKLHEMCIQNLKLV